MSREQFEGSLIEACRGVHAALDRFDHAVCEKLGISRNDLRCLNLLEFGPVQPGQVSRELGLSTGAVTALIDRLERTGYVKRVADPLDRRKVCVEATPKVYAELAGHYSAFASQIKAAFSRLKVRELSEAVSAIERLRGGCETALAHAQAEP